jgi:predicted RND superfamily exporter protein
VLLLFGAITPIPAIRNFSIQVAMTVICNYAVALLIYPSLLYFDIKRHLSGGKDCLVLPVKNVPTQLEDSGAPAAAAEKKENGVAGFVLASTPLRILILVIYAGLFCFCASGIPEVGAVRKLNPGFRVGLGF